jgi:hypothetical protein
VKSTEAVENIGKPQNLKTIGKNRRIFFLGGGTPQVRHAVCTLNMGNLYFSFQIQYYTQIIKNKFYFDEILIILSVIFILCHIYKSLGT